MVELLTQKRIAGTWYTLEGLIELLVYTYRV